MQSKELIKSESEWRKSLPCSAHDFEDQEIGVKHDNHKLRYDLVPVDALEGIAEVFTYGANKYGVDNWKRVSPRTRYLAAAFRHIAEYRKGNMLDKESKLLHLDHAITSLMMLRELSK